MTLRFSVGVEGADELRDAVRALPESLFKQAKRIFRATGVEAQRDVITRIRNGPLYRRTGTLARSIQTETIGGTLASLSTSVFSENPGGSNPVVYAPIHELGGTVRAVNKYAGVPGGPYLNIPTAANKTAAGVTRQSARTAFAAGARVLKSKRGNWFVGVVSGTKITSLFSLVRAVEIPARLEMRATVEAQLPGLISAFAELKLLE